MKYLIFIFTLCSHIAFCQVDSVLVKPDSTSNLNQPVVTGSETPVLKNTEDFSADNSTLVDPAEVSPELKKTLQDLEYQGWENGTLHRHLQTGEYKLDIMTPIAHKTFYFTRNGERKNP